MATKRKKREGLRSQLVGASAPKQTASEAVQKKQGGTTRQEAGQKLPASVRKSVERDVSKKRDVAGTKAEAQKRVQEADRKLAKTTDRRARAAYQQEKKSAQAAASVLTPDEKLARTTDRRARAAYQQKKRDALYPVAGGDRKLSTVDKQEVQHQKALWDKGEQLKKRGRTTEGQALQDRAHFDAELARARRGYSGGESGADDILPKLDAGEEKFMTDKAKEQIRAQKRYYDIGTELGIPEVQQTAQETADAIRFDGASWDRDRIRDYKALRPAKQETDAHGRPIHQYNLSRGEGEAAQAFFPAVGNQMKGSWLSLLETARAATRNMTANRYDHDYQLQKSLAEQAGRKAANERDPERQAALDAAAERETARADALRHKDAVRPWSDGQLALQRAAQQTQTVMDAIPSKGGRLVTQAAMSGVQMLPAIGASAVLGPAAGAALMGAQAAGGKAGELGARGVPAQEALARGAVSGIIEGATEKIPISNLLSMVRSAGGSKFLVNVARQAGIEATEESASYLLNYAADEAARDPAATFSLQELAENAAVGAISGAGFGGLGHVAGATVSPGTSPGASAPTAGTPMETARRVMDAVTPQETQEAPVSTSVPRDMQTPMQDGTPAQARPVADTAADETARAEDFWRRVYEAQARNDPDELSALSREADRLFDVQREAVPAASHIDVRGPEALADRTVNAFQYDNPEVKPYFREAARALLDDIGFSQASQGYRRGTGTIVRKSEAMRQAERQGLSRAELGRALEDIIQDDGRENNANAKRAEVVLDEMLSKGYVPNEALGDPDARVPASEGYLRAKEQVPGAVARGSFEDYARRNRLALETGEVTQEELRREWEQGVLDAQPQSGAPRREGREQGELTGQLLDTIRANKAVINEGGIVSRLSGSEFARGQKRLGDQVADFFASLGNKVTRLGFGDIALTKRGAKDSLMHGMSRNKAIAFSAVPSVIENGAVIDEQTNWKGRGWDSVTFGGKIQIGDQTYDMGVVVRKYGKESPNYGRYYLHEVLLTDEDGAVVPIDARTREGYPSDTAAPSMDMVAQPDAPVNTDADGYSVGAAPSGFDPYSAALNEYGAIAPGEDPARMIDVPQRTRPGTKVRRFARTFAESPGLSEEMIANFEQDAMNGLYDYTPKKLKSLEETAVKTIEDVGFDGALDQWQQVVDGHRTATDEDIALGGILLSEAVHEGDTALVQQLSAQLAAEGTAAGRAVNALRLLKRATPEGRLYYIHRMVDKLNKDYAKKLGKARDAAKDHEGVRVDDDLAQAFLDAETDEARDAALDATYDDIARQIPSSMTRVQKLAMQADEWRYLAMLGNPRTHIRNVVGNVVMKGLTGTRNAVSAGLQNALVDASKRTRTLSADSDAVAFAEQDFERMKDALSGNRMDERSEIMRRVKVLPKPIQKLADWNSKALDAEDMLFKRSAYIDSMARFLKARGVDVKNGVPDAVLEEARGHATEDALRATFQQYSALANQLSRFERGGPVQRLVVGSMVPFKRTPINIAKTGVEYSPVGLARGIYDMRKKVKSGEMSAGEAIDEMASGLTGTGVALLGAFLAHMGWLAGAGDDDDKQRYFDIAQGSQEYALTIGGHSYTIDWAAPSVLPLFVGVEAYREYKRLRGEGSEDDAGFLVRTLSALGRIADPMINMTMLSGLSGTLKSAAYNQTNMLSGMAGQVATNYLGQFVPTLAGQVARTIDPVRRTTFYDKNSDVPKSVQYLLQRQGAKIPGLSQKQPEYLDVWGRQDRGDDNVLVRAVENFVSPGYYSKRNTSAVDEELQRLNDAGYEGMLPKSVQKSAKVGDKRMSAQQWQDRQKAQGQTANDILARSVGTAAYQDLSDDQKAKFVKNVFDYSAAMGKQAAGSDLSKEDKWIQNTSSVKAETGMDPKTYIELHAYRSALDDGSIGNSGVMQGVWEDYVNGREDLTQEQKDYVLEREKFRNGAPASSTAYHRMKDAGYEDPKEIENVLEARKAYNEDGQGSLTQKELTKFIKGYTDDPAEQQKLFSALKGANWKASWSSLSRKY